METVPVGSIIHQQTKKKKRKKETALCPHDSGLHENPFKQIRNVKLLV